jgi:putative peptidoglycan lipid II flippase
MTDDRRTPGERDGEVVSPRVPGWTPRQALPGELSVGPRIDDLGSLPEPAPGVLQPEGLPIPDRSLRRGMEPSGVGDEEEDFVLAGLLPGSDLAAASAARLGGRAIALAGVVVVAGVVLSRLIGWFRTAVFLAEFGGQSKDLDSFYNAFRLPDTLFQLVAAGAIGSALVPVASALLDRGEAERARRLIATMANLMVLALIPLAVIVWIEAPSIVAVILPTSDPAQLDLRVGMTRLMLLSPIFLAVGAVMSAGLNSIGIFGAPALAPNVYNIAIIVCAIALTPFLGIYALALGVVVGAAGLVLTQANAVRRAGLYAPRIHLRDPAVRETLLLMAPRALGLGATQLVFLVNTFFADTMKADGPVTWYNSAFTALQIPVGLIGVPLGIVLLPPLSRAVASGDDARFRRLVDQSLRLLLFVVVPLTGAMMVLAVPTLAVLYQHGAFDADATASTATIYEVFLLGLVAHVLIALLAPIFYAGKDTRTPVTAALAAVAVDVVAAIVLFPFMHLEGLALAIGLGAWAEVFLLVTLMERRIGFDLRPIAWHAIAFAGGACVAAATTMLAARYVENSMGGLSSLVVQIAEIAVGGLVGVVTYLAWSKVFRLPELDAAVALARTLVGRRRRAAAELPED